MRKIFAATAAAGILLAGTAMADPIAERKAAMKSMGLAAKTIAGMVKGKTEYNKATAMLAFATINNAAIAFPHLFPAGTETGGETEAAASIWSEAAKFKAATDAFKTATAASYTASAGGADALKPAFMGVVKFCKGCHENFRVSK